MPSKSIAAGLLVALTLGLGFGSVFLPQAVAQVPNKTTSQLYQIEFVQESNCYYGSWLFPWAVILNNSSVLVQPSNATLPLTYGGAQQHLTSDSNYSTIVFSVPNGIYNYTIVPKDPFNAQESGNVTVDGSDVQVEVGQFITAMGCSSTTTTSTTSTTTTTVTSPVGAITATVTITTTIPRTTTTISTVFTGVSSGLLYGVAAVAVIFIVATSVLAIRIRKSTP